MRWRKTQKVSQKIKARLKAWVTQWAAVTSDEAGGWPNLKQRNTNWIIIIHGCRAILERDYNSPGALATRPAERGSLASPHNLKGPALEAAIITGESPYLGVKAFLLESRGDEGTRQILSIYVPQPDQSTFVGPNHSLGWHRDLETRLWRQFSQTRHKITSKSPTIGKNRGLFLSGKPFFPHCHQTMTITSTFTRTLHLAVWQLMYFTINSDLELECRCGSVAQAAAWCLNCWQCESQLHPCTLAFFAVCLFRLRFCFGGLYCTLSDNVRNKFLSFQLNNYTLISVLESLNSTVHVSAVSLG